jgi:hypothetical protein
MIMMICPLFKHLFPSPTQPIEQTWVLRCIFQGDATTFMISIPSSKDINQLKVLVHAQAQNGLLRGTDFTDLVMFKVRNVFGCDINVSTNF